MKKPAYSACLKWSLLLLICGLALLLSLEQAATRPLEPLKSIYWTNDDYLQRANLDNPGETKTISDSIHSLYGFDIDPGQGKMYWAGWTNDDFEHQIMRANLDGSGIETVFTRDEWVKQIALDTTANKIYWSEDVQHNLHNIYRANLDGSKVELLASSRSVQDIALDVKAGKMYWADLYEIYRANFDGSQAEMVIALDNTDKDVGDLAVDGDGGKIYWTEIGGWDYPGTGAKLSRANLDGSQEEALVFDADAFFSGLALNLTDGKMVWAWRDDDTKIVQADLDGSQIEILTPDAKLEFIRKLALDSPAGKMYWNTGGSHIQRASLDGSQLEYVIASHNVRGGFALDASANKRYIADEEGFGTGEVWRENLDGSQAERLVTGIQWPSDIALDNAGGKIYWTDQGALSQEDEATYCDINLSSPPKIQRANLDGSQVEDLVTTGLLRPYAIALDITHQKIYWNDFICARSIKRANLDGSEVEEIIELGYPEIGHSWGGALAVDGVAGKIYWSGPNRGIRRANLDGTEAELVGDDRWYANDIALDTAAGKMYWNGTKTRRANLDGTQEEDVISESGRHLALLFAPCYQLTRVSDGEGYSPVPAPDRSPGCPLGSYFEGAVINLQGDPAPGGKIAGWSGSDDDSDGSISNQLTMPADDHTVTTHYERDPSINLLALPLLQTHTSSQSRDVLLQLPLDERPGSTEFSDNSGHNNDAKCLSNADCPYAGKPGRYFQALSFIEERIRTSQPLTLSTHTVKLWVKTDSSQDWSGIFSTQDLGGGFAQMVLTGEGAVRVEMRDAAGMRKRYDGQTTINDNQWHQLSYTYDAASDTLKLHIDGREEPITKTADEALSWNVTAPVQLGTTRDNTLFFNGLIDLVVVYGDALAP